MKRSDGMFILVFLLIAVNLTAQEGLVVQEGLVGHWSFDALDDAEGFEDHSPNDNPGVNQGGVLIDGMKGKALYFDGNSDFGLIMNDEALPPEQLKSLGVGSISLWFRVDHIPLEHGIAPLFYYGGQEVCDFFDAANQGLIIEVGHSPIHHRSERLYFTIWKNGCTYPSFCFDSNIGISTGQWHHIVVVVDENSNTGYLDGKEMTGRNYNFGTTSYSQFFEDAIKHEVLWLGRGHWDRTEQYLEGAIDELMIFDRPLGAKEVAAIYRDTTGAVSGLKEEFSDPLALEVFPNPAESTVTISATVGSRIGIYSMDGVLLLEHEAMDENTSIDITSLPAGFYVARSGESRTKFTVEK